MGVWATSGRHCRMNGCAVCDIGVQFLHTIAWQPQHSGKLAHPSVRYSCTTPYRCDQSNLFGATKSITRCSFEYILISNLIRLSLQLIDINSVADCFPCACISFGILQTTTTLRVHTSYRPPKQNPHKTEIGNEFQCGAETNSRRQK